MADFERWRDWLRGEAERLCEDGYLAELKENNRHLRCAAVELTGRNVVASFRHFENGLVDYEVMNAPSKLFVANEAMVRVDDEHFPSVFERFRKAVKAQP